MYVNFKKIIFCFDHQSFKKKKKTIKKAIGLFICVFNVQGNIKTLGCNGEKLRNWVSYNN